MQAGTGKPGQKDADTTGSERSLRHEAEERLARTPMPSPELKGHTAEELVHELQVHQIELETQAEELWRAQLALEESRDKYLDLYEFAPLGYLTLSDKAIIEEMNLTGATLLGAERSRLVNTRFRKFIDPEYFDTWDRYFLNVLDLGEKQSFSLVIRRADGSTFPARLESIRTRFRNKENPSVRVVISDITHIRMAEAALQITHKKLTLLSSITRHDILNELMVLSGSLELALGDSKEKEIIHHINRAQKAADTIQHQIAFSREYEQIGNNAPVWQSCHSLVDTAAKQVQPGRVRVKNDLPDGMEVFADPLIVKVCFNLLDNAVRYGGKITTIRFSVQEHDGTHFIVCEDDGDGIPSGDKERIFDRGFGKHTGLGLFLSREILEITGITLIENGEPGEGARFEIALPKGAWRMAGTNG